MEDQKQRVYDALNKMGIKYEVVEHEPVHTMEDMDRLGLPEKGTLCKNLFLRDSKGKRHFLITADEKTKVDLKALGRQLGAGTLSFARILPLICTTISIVSSTHFASSYVGQTPSAASIFPKPHFSHISSVT